MYNMADRFERIIIPVDNTKESRLAVKKGILFAKLLGIEAKIISINDTHHFISSVVLEEKLKKESEAFLNEFKSIGEKFGVNLETLLLSGNPAEEIVKYAKENDLIIIPHHQDKKGLDKIIETNVSKEVVKNAPCSVLVVKIK
jgi:nucleotide-binding universal stress UspA family protein